MFVDKFVMLHARYGRKGGILCLSAVRYGGPLGGYLHLHCSSSLERGENLHLLLKNGMVDHDS